MECLGVSQRPSSLGSNSLCVAGYQIVASALLSELLSNQAPKIESIALAASSRIDGMTWL